MLPQWEQRMVQYGDQWRQTIYEQWRDPNYNFNDPARNIWNYDNRQNQVYYDGQQVAFQIYDYAKVKGWNNPERWLQMAQDANDIYYDYAITKSQGGVAGYWLFTKGLLERWKRFGHVPSRDAILKMSVTSNYCRDTNNDYAPKGTYVVDSSRECAYAIRCLIDSEEVGGPSRSTRIKKLVDFAIDHIDQWFGRRSATNVRCFMVGLTMEALIYYDTLRPGDARILPAIQKAIAGLWDTTPNTGLWVADRKTFVYQREQTNDGGRDPSPDLNLLIAPAWAWAYHKTGDIKYRQQGDEIFAGAMAAWIGGSGKIFNQSYRSSFNYLTWALGDPITKEPDNPQPPQVTPVVTNLYLVRNDNGTRLATLSNGNVINLATLPTKDVQIEAEVDTDTKSVKWGLDSNTSFRVDSAAPFVLQPASWTPESRAYTIKAIPYSELDAAGTAGSEFSVSVAFTDQPIVVNPDPPQPPNNGDGNGRPGTGNPFPKTPKECSSPSKPKPGKSTSKETDGERSKIKSTRDSRTTANHRHQARDSRPGQISKPSSQRGRR